MLEPLMKLDAAAAFVGVSPDVLNVCVELLGFPRQILVGRDERFYSAGGLVDLRAALGTEESILSAIPESQQPATPLNVVVVHVGASPTQA